MAIRTRDSVSGNNRTVVDDSRNFFLNNLTFSDSSSISSLGFAPGTLKWTLDNPNAFDLSGLDDNFGFAVASSDQYLIVGVRSEDSTDGTISGRAYIYNITTGALVHTLSNPNVFSTSADDFFGESVGISGNFAIVGAWGEGDAGGTQSGKAYIYNVTTGQRVHTLNNQNAYSTSGSDRFGLAVAISGDYAIVGAYLEDDAGGTNSGKAYIYNVTTGQLLWTLNNPNAYSTSADDYFGDSVAISGDYAIVGARIEDDAGGTSSGKAYIFNVTTGALLWTLNNPNAYSTSADDSFGESVAISGNYAIVGASNEDDAASSFSGKAYIYNVTTGALVHTLNNPNAYSTTGLQPDQFGYSVAISGNYAIVGARNEADEGGSTSGKAYIFNVTTGVLIATFNNPYSYDKTSSDEFGSSVAINSSMAFAGAIRVNSAQGLDSGAVYSFNLNNFAPMYTFTNPVNNYDGSSQGPSDNFGQRVAISGNYAIVSALNEDDFVGTQSGKAYIFNVTTGQLVWTLNNPNAFSTSASDSFGVSVAISGNYAIVGAWNEDDVGGTSSGKAYIFNVTTGQLVWTLNNPNAYSTSQSDSFGSVSISGNYAIVGSSQEDDAGGTNSGKAYIFNVTTGQLVWTLNNPNAYSTSDGDQFGSVGISGNYAIVGASSEDDSNGLFSGKAYIFNVTTGALVWTLNNPNAYDTGVLDFFGSTIAISGNYAIVGVSSEDDAGGTGSGKAYIFNVTTGQLVWTLNNPNAYSTSANDGFGVGVAISGNYAAVSSFEADSGGNTSGKAYIYNVTTGQLLYTLNNPNAYSTSEGDNFAGSVAMSDNYVIVGARDEDSFKGVSSGKAYIYNLATPEKYTGFTSLSGLEKLADQNTIVDRSYLKWTLNNPNAYSTSASDRFGYSVAISGNYAIVGAYFEDDAGGTDSGKAYVYNVNTGQLLYTLNNPNAYSTSASDNFGSSVAISGNFAIFGVQNEDDAGGTESGKAYIYNISTGALLWTLNNPNAYSTSGGDWFSTVAISGNFAIVGAYGEDDLGNIQNGKAYIYNVTTGTLLWTLNDPDPYVWFAGDNFGWSVGISGNYAIVGAPNEDDPSGISSGKAYIFNVTTGQLLWTLNNPNAYSTSENDRFGNSVAISGNYAIVGAPNEDDPGGTESGKAYIFNVTTGQLLYTLNNPNVYATSSGDEFAGRVDISGNYAIVAARVENDIRGTASGVIYVFSVITGSLIHVIYNPNAVGTSTDYFSEGGMSISGNYVIASSYFEQDINGNVNSGRAYIFSINNLNYKSLEDKLISLFHY